MLHATKSCVLLFSMYLSDLNSFLTNKIDGLKEFQSLEREYLNDEKTFIFLKWATQTILWNVAVPLGENKVI